LNIRSFSIAVVLFATACQSPGQKQEQASPKPEQPSPNAQYDALKFADAQQTGKQLPPPPATMALEVLLDRLGFSSGVIDGKATRFDKLALRGFQSANGLPETGELDEPTRAALARSGDVPATRLVQIPEAFAKGPFVPDLPRATSKQVGYDELGYRDLMEALAERFHTTPETIVALNDPAIKLGAGAVIRVPNVADVDSATLRKDERGWNRTLVSLAVSPTQLEAAKVVVDKSDGAVRAYDASGKLLAQFPATMGSQHDPLPIGEWKIQGVSRNPDYHYNPDLFWDAKGSDKGGLIKPGPNSPVGVVWLDLSKEHYGIHGTGEPASIGVSESHGCVRLTNWDAARLAQMVKPDTSAILQE
jgi:lipoprotein-anchoring transpeptidase ErfK/SrfK